MNLIIREYDKTAHLPEKYIDLYIQAFPETERRNWKSNNDAESWLKKHDTCHSLLLFDGDMFIGFLNFWILVFNDGQKEKKIIYGEHLVIDPLRRGGGAGSFLMKHILNSYPCGLLLEIEPPVDDITCRRKALYERLGLVFHSDIQYLQPAYFPGNSPIELCIMSSPGISSYELEYHIIPVLKKTVYGK